MKYWPAILLLVTACSTKQKASITDEAYSNEGRRRELFEATLRVLDENPDYVDELYKLTLRHPKTLQRQFEATARSLSDRDVAERTAAALVNHPKGLEQVMVATLEAASDKPNAANAVVDAMQKRADIAASLLVKRPAELATISKAIITRAFAEPNTKEILTKIVKEAADPKAAARSSWTPKR
ncbi:MAG TPA: hypothetical protein VMZ53_22005 [Kofleriaceae bacterium]|nr:hypothetical protein [Kofleriaceae bacterium]